MAIIDWEYKFKKQLELNKFLLQMNVEILRSQGRNFMEKLYWTQEYPEFEGWYWVMHDVKRQPTLEYFSKGSDGLISTVDSDYNEYGPDSYNSYWFSNEAVKEPENT